MLCLCFKCKRKTETIDVTVYQFKKNLYIVKGICNICGSKKSTFTKKENLIDIEE